MNTIEIIKKFEDRILYEIRGNNSMIAKTTIEEVVVKYNGVNLGILKAVELFPYEDLDNLNLDVFSAQKESEKTE